MKVKNIMFSGVMASILMMGGAYAANNADGDLATAGFVRGAYNAAVEQAVGNVTAASNSGIVVSEVSGEGGAASITIGVDDNVLATKQSVTTLSGNVSTLSGNVSTLSGKVQTLETTVGDADSGLVKDVADLKSSSTSSASDLTALSGRVTTAENDIDALETLVGSTAVATQISTAVAAEATIARAAEQANAADIDALESGKVDKVTGSSLVADTKVAAYDAHIANGDIHVTAEQKTAWTAKQNALNTDQLAAVSSGITSEKVTKYDGYNTTLGNLSDDISAEATARQNADNALDARLDVIEGEGEGSIKKAVADEEARAEAAYATKSALSAVETTANAAATKTYVDTELGKKQNTLTASTNIQISETGVITATDTTYSAGTGLSLSGTTFSLGYDVTDDDFSPTASSSNPS